MWLPVNTQIKQTTPFRVSTTALTLQDVKSISLDKFTALDDNSLFTLEQLPVRPYEKDDNVQMDITVEMNLN